MGGSSGQVVGYRYYANFLVFIGNRIERLLAINFDKRQWLNGRLVPYGEDGQMNYLDYWSLYGENEGGVSGQMRVHYGSNNQQPDGSYKKYMNLQELPCPAYPYQSYLSFSSPELSSEFSNLTDEQLQELADEYNNGISIGKGFYLGNSGYMKEMLLWPKRIHVRNDGREQWYDLKAEIGLEWFEDKTEDLTQHYIATAGDFVADFETNRRNSLGGRTYKISKTPNSVMEGSFGIQGGEIYGVNADQNWPIKSKGLTDVAFSPNYSGSFSFELSVLSVGKTDVLKPFKQLSSFQILDSWEIEQGGYGYNTHGYKIKCFVYPGETLHLRFDTEFPTSESWSNTHHAIQIIADRPKLGVMHNGSVSGTDINPIHKIREILTDDTAMNKPESSVNNINFIKAADVIWRERLGISWSVTEKSCIDAINELCYHIEAGIRVNRQTGLYEMVLFRDNWFDESEIHQIAESKIKSMQYEITNADEVINQGNVNFYDRENIKNSSFSISESGLIQTLGRVNAETLDFPYFMNIRNAEIVANWKLKQLSTGAFKGSFTTGWREARKWNRYDLIRLPWSKRWTGTTLVRIMSINLGGPTNNQVTIEFIEVVPATGMMNTTIVADNPIDTKPEVPKPCNAKVFELPYFEAVQAFGEREVNIELTDNPEVGYLCAIAEKPQNNSLNAALYADSGNGFERVATINYCETAYLDQAIDRISSAFVVKNVGNLASVRIGSQIFINDEIMVYQSYDATTKVLTVKRGAFGTPQNHSLDSILYFADDFIALDQTIYVQTEIVNARVLTTTPSGVLDLVDAVNYEVEFNARAIRPYPPANVKINGEYWLAEIETDLVLTWVDRNRIQQTGGEIIGWYEGNVIIEPGTSAHLTLTEYDENQTVLATNNVNLTGATSYTMPMSSIQANTRTIEITLRTVRDGYECLQPFVHTVELSQFFSAPYDLTVEFKND